MENNKNMKNKNNQQGKNGNKGKKKSNNSSYIFLSIVALLYVILYFVNPDKTLIAFKYSFGIFKTVLPVLSMVLLFLVLFNMINEKKLKNVVEKSPQFVQYLVMTAFGTFSHGPMYAWYPLMKGFHDKGISYGSIATFLYARGIKLAMMPALISFFGIKYTIVLTIYLLIFSNIQGIVVDILIKDKAQA